MSTLPAAGVPPALVIGYGNVLCGDDAAGPLVVERLAGLDLPGVSTLLVHQLAPEIAARLEGVATVVFVDASVRAAAVESREILPAAGEDGSPGHTSDPAGVLGLAAALYGFRPRGWLVSVPARVLGFGAPMTASTRGWLGAAEREVVRLLGRDVGGTGGEHREAPPGTGHVTGL